MLDNIKDYRTPCYVYRLSEIKKQTEKLRAVFLNTVIYYSAKANPNKEILTSIYEEGLSIDVASKKELEAAIQIGFEKEKISYIGPGKTIEELKYAVSESIGEIVVESEEEIKRIIELNRSLGKNQRVIIRVNPSADYNNSSLTMTGKASAFGIDEEQIPKLLESYVEKINIVGFHFYIRSQVFSIDELMNQFEYSILYAKKIQKQYSLKLKRINLGGGIPVKYYDNQSEINLKDLAGSYKKLYEKHDINFNLSLESGRFLVASSGLFLASVEYKKESRGKNYLILNGGFSCNASLVGVGQVLKQNFKCTSSSKNIETEEYTLAGPSCTPIDIMGSDVRLPVSNPGDILYFFNCGSYGPSYSPTEFLGLIKPREYFIK